LIMMGIFLLFVFAALILWLIALCYYIRQNEVQVYSASALPKNDEADSVNNLLKPPSELSVCLVTGGGGFVGKELVLQLLQQKTFNVVKIFDLKKTWDPKECNYEGQIAIEYIIGDVRNMSEVITAVSGCSTVFHLAALIDLRDSIFVKKKIYDTNFTGTCNIVRACKMCKCKRLIYLSSASIIVSHNTGENLGKVTETMKFDKPVAPYPMTKLMAENVVLAAGENRDLHSVALRPWSIIGLGAIGWDIFENKTPIIKLFKSVRQSFISVESMADVLIKTNVVLEKNPTKITGKFYYVSDFDKTYPEMDPFLVKLHGNTLKVINLELLGSIVCFTFFLIDYICLGHVHKLLTFLTPIGQTIVETSVLLDNAAAVSDLNFSPLQFETFLQNMRQKIQKKRSTY